MPHRKMKDGRIVFFIPGSYPLMTTAKMRRLLEQKYIEHDKITQQICELTIRRGQLQSEIAQMEARLEEEEV